MIKIWYVLTSIIIIIIGVIISCNPSIACEGSLSAILDTNVDNNLHLEQLYKTDIAPNLVRILEFWVKEKQSSVSIERWVFENAKEIDKFVKDDSGLANGFSIPQWDKSTEFGDKTHWIEPGIVVFAKGKTLVRMYVCLGDISPDSKKEYTRKIAKSIAKKL